ncbi:MAG: cell wall-binding repeat-containing protein [Bacillota bacterium]|nr:cell wall-binding repeat-containing protein [Bacillota bacterium]
MKNKKTLLTLFLLCCTFILFPKNAYALNTDRLQGNTRYETSAQICESGWQQSNTAIIANGDGFADALCSAPLAKKYNAPILLTDSNKLNPAASSELKRLGVTQVFIVGGTGVVSSQTENQIRALGINNITRLAGTDRYETSVKVAEQLDASNGIVLATGSDFPDALSIAPIAAKKGIPILLTSKNAVPEIVNNYISEKSIPNTYVIGGTGVISNESISNIPNTERLYGPDRYKTNMAILNKFSSEFDFSNIYLATGENFPDALSGSALAAQNLSPMLLCNTSLTCDAVDYYNKYSTASSKVIFLGGQAVLPQYAVQLLDTISSITANNYSDLYAALKIYIGKAQDLPVYINYSISPDELCNAIQNVCYNEGYAGYISSYGYQKYSGNKWRIHISYKDDPSGFLTKLNAVNTSVQTIISSIIKPGMTELQKETAIHNYIVNNTSYDYSTDPNYTEQEDSFNAYGVFLKNKAVCEGYSEAMFRLLNAAGVNCQIVIGSSKKSDGSGESGGSHAWNIVLINGNYYQIDSTWDDPVPLHILTYNYFNVNDDELSKDHIWDTSQYPKCTSVDLKPTN